MVRVISLDIYRIAGVIVDISNYPATKAPVVPPTPLPYFTDLMEEEALYLEYQLSNTEQVTLAQAISADLQEIGLLEEDEFIDLSGLPDHIFSGESS